jgi:hypothetical protein
MVGPQLLAKILEDLDSAPVDGNYAVLQKNRIHNDSTCLSYGFLTEEMHVRICIFLSRCPQATCKISDLVTEFGSVMTDIWLCEACESNVMGRYARRVDGEKVQLTGTPIARAYGDFKIDFNITPAKTKNYMGFEITDTSK